MTVVQKYTIASKKKLALQLKISVKSPAKIVPKTKPSGLPAEKQPNAKECKEESVFMLDVNMSKRSYPYSCADSVSHRPSQAYLEPAAPPTQKISPTHHTGYPT